MMFCVSYNLFVVLFNEPLSQVPSASAPGCPSPTPPSSLCSFSSPLLTQPMYPLLEGTYSPPRRSYLQATSAARTS